MKKSFNLLLCLYIISVLFLIQGCKKGDLPEVITVEVTLVTNNSATTGGEIISDGGCDITEKGVCWNKTGNPVITTDSKTSNGKGSEPFTSNITGLEAGVTYYLRAYATNGPGTAYGEEIVFTTKISDIDGNLYDIIKIGTQVWMAENLKTTKLNDNTSLPNITDNTEWASATLPGYSWYDNNESYSKPLYGALYNWYAASDSKLCPAGWHVPTDAEFQALEITLGFLLQPAALPGENLRCSPMPAAEKRLVNCHQNTPTTAEQRPLAQGSRSLLAIQARSADQCGSIPHQWLQSATNQDPFSDLLLQFGSSQFALKIVG